MLDDAMRDAFGFPAPPPVVGSLVRGSLRARARVLRLLPARSSKSFVTGQPQRSWPNGYQIAQLGPPPLLQPEQPE
jgi:hypothetical protein